MVRKQISYFYVINLETKSHEGKFMPMDVPHFYKTVKMMPMDAPHFYKNLKIMPMDVPHFYKNLKIMPMEVPHFLQKKLCPWM